ncbi:MAG: hypothetical protein LH632_22245 [Rhodoferax sp.]|nr:hypothetical protein [Rhodoferax sp.]
MATARYVRAIYWRAKPGKLQAYSDYLREQVEPIDCAAQRDGVLHDFSTLIDPAPNAAWSHMRLFYFASAEQRANMVKALGAAAVTLTPDASVRQARAALAATLRERVGEADFEVL